MKKLSVILFAVVMSVMMVVPAFADTFGELKNVPEFPAEYEVYKDRFPYISVYQYANGDYSFIFSEKPVTSDPQKLEFNFYSNPTYKLTLKSNMTWGSGSLNEIGFCTAPTKFIWANHTIYDYNGGVFYEYKYTLYKQIQNVTDKTLTEDTMPSVISTFNTLAYIGAGLLAMLVVLELFGKRSLIKR